MNITESGDFKDLESYLKRVIKKSSSKQGATELAIAIVNRLKQDTPKESGLTAASWDYKLSNTSKGIAIEIINKNNNNDSVNIAKIIHFGHGTGTGGYVPPKPYIVSAIDAAYNKKIKSILTDLIK